VPEKPEQDTIAGIATAHGRGSVGIVRLSGPNLAPLAQALLEKPLSPRLANYTAFVDAQGESLDQGIALFFPAPHSYTGEDILELQGHGGMAVLQLVLQRCLELGARLAEPGEFTKRAFLNGKLDLAQAESVADLIEATTGQAARSAVRSLRGEFSQVIRHVVEELIHLRMLVEAMLDFPEEVLDAPDIRLRDAQLGVLCDELDKILDLARQGSLLREGAHIVLVGQPNVGKSSLLNCLSGEEVALVSEVPGTTRDVIRQAIQIGGVPLHVVDTAGLRDSADTVEQMGIARARSAMQRADAALILLDARLGMGEKDRQISGELSPGIPRIYVFNKIDLLEQPPRVELREEDSYIYLSAKTGAGMDLLRDKLLELIGWHQEAGVFMARERHIRALVSAREHLRRAEGETGRAEVFAEELRLAQEQLNLITGEFTADDLLGEIFSRFCIGK
jgi:tRNA modification GTPase